MHFTLTVREDDMNRLRTSLLDGSGKEAAAYLLCGSGHVGEEYRFVCNDIVIVTDQHYARRGPDQLGITSSSYSAIAKRARREGFSVLFAHSHPCGPLTYSAQDDREEPKLHEFLSRRIPGRFHGSLLLTPDGVTGRAWRGGFSPIARIRVIGDSWRFFDQHQDRALSDEAFDRQVRAFGSETQSLLSSLHIGVVGAGGTGSAVVEQLARLGVGQLSIFDDDKFERSNVNRVFGSSVRDEGRPKVTIAQENVERIGLGTIVNAHANSISRQDGALALRACDIVFSCVDKEAPRSILMRLSTQYLIPIIDTGVVVASSGTRILDVAGRATTFFAGEACLFCRGRLSSDRIRLEGISGEERERLRIAGYAPGLGEPNPAVISFTATVASLAVSEMLQRITGFMRRDRQSTEVLYLADKSSLRTSRVSANDGCFCSNRSQWATGDTEDFLGLAWGT